MINHQPPAHVRKYKLKKCPGCGSNYNLEFERNEIRTDERVTCTYCGVSGRYSDYEYTELFGDDPHIDSAKCWNDLASKAERSEVKNELQG